MGSFEANEDSVRHGQRVVSPIVKNYDSMGTLAADLGVSHGEAERLVDDAWARAVQDDPQIRARALSSGVKLVVAHGEKSAAVSVFPNKRESRTKPFYALYAGAQGNRPRPERFSLTKGTLIALKPLMPGCSEAQIVARVRDAIDGAVAAGLVDTYWRPANATGACQSIWMSAGPGGDKDIRVAFSTDEAGSTKVFYAAQQSVSTLLTTFAFMGQRHEAYAQLAKMAAYEPWDGGEGTYGALEAYMRVTYARAERHGQVAFLDNGSQAALNTGLTTGDGEDIVALFQPNNKPGCQCYTLQGFVTAGSPEGQRSLSIVQAAQRVTYPEPVAVRADAKPEASLDNMLDHLDRMPAALLGSVGRQDPAWMALLRQHGAFSPKRGHRGSFREAGAFVRKNRALYAELEALTKPLADRAFEEFGANPGVALPVYDVRRDCAALALPVRVGEGDVPDAALLVEADDAGTMRAYAIVEVQEAYVGARVIGPVRGAWLDDSYRARQARGRREAAAFADGLPKDGPDTSLEDENARLRDENALLRREVAELRACLEARRGSVLPTGAVAAGAAGGANERSAGTGRRGLRGVFARFAPARP